MQMHVLKKQNPTPAALLGRARPWGSSSLPPYPKAARTRHKRVQRRQQISAPGASYIRHGWQEAWVAAACAQRAPAPALPAQWQWMGQCLLELSKESSNMRKGEALLCQPLIALAMGTLQCLSCAEWPGGKREMRQPAREGDPQATSPAKLSAGHRLEGNNNLRKAITQQ